jgi:hypothetical protein
MVNRAIDESEKWEGRRNPSFGAVDTLSRRREPFLASPACKLHIVDAESAVSLYFAAV